MKKFCDITTRNELADFLGVPRNKLTYILYIKKVDSYYSSFEIPKKSGGVRKINAPKDDLKYIQKRLADALWEYQVYIWKKYKINPNISHGFEKHKGIITNARIHRNRRYLLNIDLEDFFNSFHFGRVRGFFEKNRNFSLPNEVAVVIAQLSCFEGTLPQGAPTSPIITNMMCQILDNRLLKIAKSYKLNYTRYADDLTFSTNNKEFEKNQHDFLTALKKEIERAGFKLNDKKTRLQFRDYRQTVTGLVVNKKLNVNQTYCRVTKSMAHALYSKGEFIIDGSQGTLAQLEGRFSFINQLDWYNNKLENKKRDSMNFKRDFMNFNGREREYRRFLFYKYFFNNSMPVIVTEGKTDVRYIKAALKNLYKEYPRLISKDEDGNFQFKLYFLRKSKKLRYFFGIQLYGGDTIQQIYQYFIDGTEKEKIKFPNYYEYFCKMGSKPKAPVCFLFDNEINSQRPLKKFINKNKIEENKIQLLRDNLHLKLKEDGNVYLLTNPLVDNKDECEIENLFLEETIKHKIDGKELCLKDQYDIKKYYGKEIFSKYIFSNYESIEFSRFRPLLNAIDSVLISYAQSE